MILLESAVFSTHLSMPKQDFHIWQISLWPRNERAERLSFLVCHFFFYKEVKVTKTTVSTSLQEQYTFRRKCSRSCKSTPYFFTPYYNVWLIQKLCFSSNFAQL